MLVGDGVDDQVEAPRHRGHLRRIGGDHDMVGAQAARVGFLAGRAAEQRHLGAHGLGQLQPHVAQAAQTDDGHLAAGAHIPVAQRRVGRDARAQQRRGAGQIQPLGHLEHEMLGNDDLLAVAAVGARAVDRVGAVVGVGGAVFAVLFPALSAGVAVAARLDHAAHADRVAGLEARDLGADLQHAAHDFVAGHHRIPRAAPVVADVVHVGVADPAVQDLDDDVVRPRAAAVELEQAQAAGGEWAA